MTAIQILEKLGADANFNIEDLQHSDKNDILALSQEPPIFNAILLHIPPEETPDQDDAPEEDAPEEDDSKESESKIR